MDQQAKTTIQINGRVYDARTGQIVRSGTPSVTRGINMDGVSKGAPLPNTVKQALPVQPSAAVKPKIRKPRTPGQTLDVRAVKKPKRSQTLHRSAVKKPKPTPAAQATAIATPTLRMHPSNTARAERAKHFSLNRQVSRFGNYMKPKPVIAKLSVAKAPIEAAPAAVDVSTHIQTVKQPSASPAPSHTAQNHTKKHKEEVFAHRIAAANTHLLKYEQKKPLRERMAKRMRVSPKLVSIGAACIAVTILGGFFAYQRIPTVAMRVAASQAGFQGSLPSAIPNGYAFSGPIRAEKDSITLTYASRSDNRKILISQKPTEWTSESLLSNFILDSKLRFQTYQDKGLTIYMYNDGSATWVDKGVWYNVTSQGALNSQQILSLAASM